MNYLYQNTVGDSNYIILTDKEDNRISINPVKILPTTNLYDLIAYIHLNSKSILCIINDCCNLLNENNEQLKQVENELKVPIINL